MMIFGGFVRTRSRAPREQMESGRVALSTGVQARLGGRGSPFLPLTLGGIRDGFPRFPGSEAFCVDTAQPRQAGVAQDEPQRRLRRVHESEEGFRGRLRIAAFHALQASEHLLAQPAYSSLPVAIFSDAGLPNSVA